MNKIFTLSTQAVGYLTVAMALNFASNANAANYNSNQYSNRNSYQTYNQDSDEDGSYNDGMNRDNDSYYNRSNNDNRMNSNKWNRDNGSNYNQSNKNIYNRSNSDYNRQTGYNYTSQNDADDNYNNNDEGYNNKSNKSDADLTKDIRSKIGSGWFSKGYENVQVMVNNGNVTLQGTVKTWEDKNKVEKEVRNIDGVKNVDSQIRVRDPSSKEVKRQYPQDVYKTSADDQLNKKIRDNVSTGWLWDSYTDVSLNTSNGVVTLEGNVDSNSDQQKLMSEIQKISGVKQVKSNLKINK